MSTSPPRWQSAVNNNDRQLAACQFPSLQSRTNTDNVEEEISVQSPFSQWCSQTRPRSRGSRTVYNDSFQEDQHHLGGGALITLPRIASQVFFKTVFYSGRDASFPEILFILHSHNSCRPLGDCGGSRDRTRDCCVTAWYQLVDLTTELPHPTLPVTQSRTLRKKLI
jgi:hypothetical protein